MSDAIKAAKARAKRAQMIELLRVCTCNYPLETLRNRSGHRGDCPAHQLYIELHDNEMGH